MVKYSAAFMAEQIHSLSTSLAKVTQALRRLAHEVAAYRGQQAKQTLTQLLLASTLGLDQFVGK